MYLYKPSGEALRCEGYFGYDATDKWQVMPFLEKRANGFPLQCYFPAGMMYGIARDSSWDGNKPSFPDFQHFANSRRNKSFSITYTKSGGSATVSAATNCHYFNLTHNNKNMSGFAPKTGDYGTDLIIKEYQGTRIAILRETGTSTADISQAAHSNFTPSFSLLQYIRPQAWDIPPNPRVGYSFAMAINSTDVGFGAYVDPITVAIPFVDNDSYVDWKFANPRGFLGDDTSSYTPNTTYYRGFWNDTTSDAEFQISRIHVSPSTIIIHGSIYRPAPYWCSHEEFGAFGTPWIVFDKSQLVFDSGKTSGTFNIAICENIEGYCGWNIA